MIHVTTFSKMKINYVSGKINSRMSFTIIREPNVCRYSNARRRSIILQFFYLSRSAYWPCLQNELWNCFFQYIESPCFTLHCCIWRSRLVYDVYDVAVTCITGEFFDDFQGHWWDVSSVFFVCMVVYFFLSESFWPVIFLWCSLNQIRKNDLSSLTKSNVKPVQWSDTAMQCICISIDWKNQFHNSYCKHGQ